MKNLILFCVKSWALRHWEKKLVHRDMRQMLLKSMVLLCCVWMERFDWIVVRKMVFIIVIKTNMFFKDPIAVARAASLAVRFRRNVNFLYFILFLIVFIFFFFFDKFFYKKPQVWRWCMVGYCLLSSSRS